MPDPVFTQLIELVKAYKTPPEAIELIKEHPPLVISGTSGAGQDTLTQAIIDRGAGARVVTTTTRPPREGEKNGREYWFVSEARMLEMIQDKAFFEVKLIHDQQISGTSIAAYQEIVDQGQTPIMRIDVQGIEEFRRYVFSLRPVFLIPPNFETWMERLDKRDHGRMSHVERLRRLHSAKAELQMALANPHFVLILNDDIQRAAQEVIGGQTEPAAQARNREVAQQLIEHIGSY